MAASNTSPSATSASGPGTRWQGRGRSSRIFQLLGILTLVCVAYGNAIANGFAQDDPFLIEKNTGIRSLSNIPSFFATDLFDGAYPAARYYRPLVPVTFALEYALVGLTPYLYHLSNVLLHALVVVLVYLLSRRLFEAQTIAIVAAALFAVHPVHTEAVTAISGRGDLLGAVFVLLAAIVYTDYPARISLRGSLAILACVTLALLSKESSLASLVLFPLIDLVRAPPKQGLLATARNSLRDKAPLVAGLVMVTLVYGIVREAVTASEISLVELGFNGDRHGGRAPLILKLATSAKVLGISLKQLILPYPLSADYDYNQIPLATRAITFASAVPMLAMLAALVAGVRWRATRGALFFGTSFLLIGLFPIAFFLPFVNIPFAERYLYLPSLGLCFAAGGMAASASRRVRVTAVVVIAVLVIPLSVARTAIRNLDWRNDFTLYEATVKTSPNSSKAHANRAVALAARAEEMKAEDPGELRNELFGKAAAHFERSLAIDPQAARVHLLYGYCLRELGRYASAEQEFLVAAQLGLGEALLATYRTLVVQVRLHLDESPQRALRLHRRAELFVREQIRPAAPPKEVGGLISELEVLDVQLQESLARAEAGR